MSQQQNLRPTLSTKDEEEEEEEEEKEEALSLSDLPSKPNSPSNKLNFISNPTDDFEFRISISANETDFQTEMCAADDVFCNGTILPLRPSVSSCTDSMDLSSSSGTNPTTSRSGSSSSSGSSSYCVSRSHSTKSVPTVPSVSDQPRRSVSNNFFYAFPSPSPQLRTSTARKSNASSGRKSTSSVPGTILRLGVLPTPEIDIIRSRRANEKKPNSTVEKKPSASVEKKQQGFGFGCKCVPDEVVEPVGTPVSRSKMEATKKERNGGDEEWKKVEKKGSPLKFNSKKGESMCRTRIFNWIEELSGGKFSQL